MTPPSSKKARLDGVPPHVRQYLEARAFPDGWMRLYRWIAATRILAALASLALGSAVTLALLPLVESRETLFTASGALRPIVVGTAILATTLAPVFVLGPVMDALLGLLPDRLRLFVRWQETQDRGSLLVPSAPRVGSAERARPEDFLDIRARIARRRAWAVAACVALVAGGAWPMGVAATARTVVTEAGLQRHGVLSDELIAWSDVERVEVGCARVCRRDTLRYDLRTRSGEALRAVGGCPDRAQLEALEELDARTRSHAIPRVRATHEDGSPLWDSQCTERVARRTGFDRARLDPIAGVD